MKPSPLFITEGQIEVMFYWSFLRVCVNTNRSEAHYPTPLCQSGRQLQQRRRDRDVEESVLPPSLGLPTQHTTHSIASCSSFSSPAFFTPLAPSQTAAERGG